MSKIDRFKTSIAKFKNAKSKTSIYSIYDGSTYAGVKGRIGLEEKIRNVPRYLASAAVRGALKTGLSAFDHAMEIVPVDTGQMARSGRLTLNNDTYARGECDDSKATSVDIVRQEEPLAPTPYNLKILKSGSVNINISFQRIGKDGENVALLTHETLLPHGTGPKEARKHGTSGKFIEIPLNEVSNELLTNIQEEIDKSISVLSK
jgi:hypothetical protein